jgi:prevent-host-death family protein
MGEIPGGAEELIQPSLRSMRSGSEWLAQRLHFGEISCSIAGESTWRDFPMVRISEGECQRQWSEIRAMAIAEPVTITSEGRDRMVLMSAEEYSRLKRRDRQVMTLEDFTDEDIAALEEVRAPSEAAAFNHEVTE